MDPTEEHNFMGCGQTIGPNFGFHGVRHGADLKSSLYIQI